MVRRVKTDYSCVFSSYCVMKRVFRYLGNGFCRSAEVKALMYSIAFLAGRSQKWKSMVLVHYCKKPTLQIGIKLAKQ